MFRPAVLASLIAVVATTFCVNAHAILISTLEDFTNGGNYFGQVSVEDNGIDTVQVIATISGFTPAQEGDILGLWFGVNDFVSSNNYSASGADIVSSIFGDPVSINFGGGNNLNGGTPPTSLSTAFNFAFQIGSQGSAGGAISTTSFLISGTGLSESSFTNEFVGMRVQSTGSDIFSSTSSKLLGTVTGDTHEVPEPASTALLGIGLLGLLGSSVYRRRKLE